MTVRSLHKQRLNRLSCVKWSADVTSSRNELYYG